MTAGDRPAFLQLLALLGATYREPIDEPRVGAYWEALSDMPVAALADAVRAALRECKFFPRPAELRERAGYVPISPAAVNEQLSAGISGKPVGPFVGLFVARLGGWRGVEDRLPVVRLPLVERLYPGILAAARARGIEIPTEAQASDRVALLAPTAPTGPLGTVVAAVLAREPGCETRELGFISPAERERRSRHE